MTSFKESLYPSFVGNIIMNSIGKRTVIWKLTEFQQIIIAMQCPKKLQGTFKSYTKKVIRNTYR